MLPSQKQININYFNTMSPFSLQILYLKIFFLRKKKKKDLVNNLEKKLKLVACQRRLSKVHLLGNYNTI